MEKADVKFLWYYLAKRILNNAEWDESLQRAFVRLENDIIILTADEWNYLKEITQWDSDN